MRLLGFVIALFISLAAQAQGSVVSIQMNVIDEDLNKALAGATIEIYQNGKLYETKTSASNGKVPQIDLPVGSTYTIHIKKDGYVTKLVEVNANFDHPEDLPPAIYQKMEPGLFKEVEGVDFAFLQTTPVAKFVISKKSGMLEMDVAHTNDMLNRIEQLKKQMEQQRIENEKKEAEAKKKEADYQAYMKAGDNAMTTNKYDVAISQYELALQTKPGDPTAQSKLDDAKKKKAEAEEGAAKQKEFAQKMEQAKAAYTAKKLEEALALYKEASALMPNEALPKERIAAIEAELKAQKDKEANYQKYMNEGQTAMDANLYADAITKYTAALTEKPGDPAAQAKLDEAKKKKLEQEQADLKAKEQQAKYDALIKEADNAFNAKNYDLAKTKYNEALTVKPADPHATAKLKEIEEILLKQKQEADAAQKKEEEYKKLMAEGETQFNQKNWESAKQKYTAALEIKPNDPAALAKIDLINKEIAKQQEQDKLNADYNQKMSEAKALYDQKKYSEAKAKYQEASNIKPQEQEPKAKIAEIEKLIQDQELLVQKEKDYQNFMTEGDQLKNIKDYTAAIDRYNKALAIKPGDQTATQKIAEINKLIEEEKKKAEQEKLYADYMAKADQAFNAKDYTNAKLNYQKAFEIKQDPAITARLKEIDDLIAKTQNEQQTQAKYDGLMKEADALYKAGDYEKALAKYEEASLTKPNEAAPKEKISELKQKIQSQQEQAEKDKKFADYVAKGDAAMNSKDYQTALANYQEAIKIKPDPAITQKIGQLNTLISQQSQQEANEQKYKTKIAEADAAFNDKNWDLARALYQEALTIKPNDSYATQRIADIEKAMQAETAEEVERNYQKIITKADGLFNEGKYDEALVYYNNAKNLKPSDVYPQKKIDEINKIKTDQQNQQQQQAKLQQEYDALIKEADAAFNTKNYTVALAKYKEALTKKPNETYPQNRIAEINTKLNEQNQQNEAEKEYNNYITQANTLFDQGNYLEAINFYRQALSVKPNDPYATNRIDECTRLEQAKSNDEAEKEYQKILTAAQKKFDEGDYMKALEYYKRAQSIRPADPIPQKKIDEINQILNNQKNEAEFNSHVQKANTYFEKGDWKNAKIYYEKALAIKDDSYCKSQIDIINKKMQQESGVEINKEYQKLIDKADEYFDAKNYEKAKSLYERALKLKPDDAHPKARLDEIDRILNPDKYIAESGGLPDYGKPVNMTEEEIEAMMIDAEDQDEFTVNQKVDEQRQSAEDKTSNDADKQNDHNWETKVETGNIQEDLEEKEWSAEVKRTEANETLVETQIDLEDTQSGRTETNENDVQRSNQSVTQINTDIERRNENDDLPRLEYEADVERIKIEQENEERTDANDQTDIVHHSKDYVTTLQEEHISEDPNNDIARKNTEVYVEDYEVTLINKNNQDAWAQENEVMGAKNYTEELTDEITANNLNNDVPREESAQELSDYTVDKENSDRNEANSQYDETIDAKNHEEKMSIEIEQNNMDNDIPRQQTEIEVEKTELEIEDKTKSNSIHQDVVVNNSDDKLDEIEIGIEEDRKQDDKPREENEELVVDLDDEIYITQTNLSETNEDNSHATVDHTERINDEKTTADVAADIKNTENTDATTDAVEDLIEENKTISDGNTEEVNATEDYVDELKVLDPKNENTPMKNQLGEKYPEGVTEEVFAINDENGVLVKYVVRRIVVVNGTGYNYEKVQTRYGTITYTRDGEPIAEYQWTDETEAATLTRN